MLSFLSQQIEGNTAGLQNLGAIIAGGMINLLFSFILFICMIVATHTCNSPWKENIDKHVSFGALIGAIQIGLGVVVFVYNSYAHENFIVNYQKIQTFMNVNDCLD